jgi:hypothetical protein
MIPLRSGFQTPDFCWRFHAHGKPSPESGARFSEFFEDFYKKIGKIFGRFRKKLYLCIVDATHEQGRGFKEEENTTFLIFYFYECY